MKSNQRLANTIMVGTLALSLVGGSISIGDTNINEQFKDMSTHWSSSFVLPLAEQGVIGGYADGTFKPDNNIKRIEYIVLTLKAMGETMRTTETGEYWGLPYIEKAIELGLVDSTSTESSDYEKLITRQEMASIIVKANELIETADYTEEWLDYSESLIGDITNVDSKYQEEVTKAYALNFIGGYPDGTFKPLGSATRAEASVVIAKLLDSTMRTPIEMPKPMENSGAEWIDFVHAKDIEYIRENLVKEHTTTTYENGVLTIGEGTYGNVPMVVKDDYVPELTARLNNLLNYMVRLDRFSNLKAGDLSISEDFGEIHYIDVSLKIAEIGARYFQYQFFNDFYQNVDNIDEYSRTKKGASMALIITSLSDDNTVRDDEYWKTRLDPVYEAYMRDSLKATFGDNTGSKIGDYIIQEYISHATNRNEYPYGKSTTIDGITITVPSFYATHRGELVFMFEFE